MINQNLEKDITNNMSASVQSNEQFPIYLDTNTQALNQQPTDPGILKMFLASFAQGATELGRGAYNYLENNLTSKDTSYNPLRDPLLLSRGQDFIQQNAEFFKDSPNAEITKDRLQSMQNQEFLNSYYQQRPITATIGNLLGAATDPLSYVPFIGAASVAEKVGLGATFTGRLLAGIGGGSGLGYINGAAEQQLNPNYTNDQKLKDTMIGASLCGLLGTLPDAIGLFGKLASKPKDISNELQSDSVTDNKINEKIFNNTVEQFNNNSLSAAENKLPAFDLSDNYNINLSNPVSWALTKFAKLWNPSVIAADSDIPGVSAAGAKIFGSFWHTKGEDFGIETPYTVQEIAHTNNYADLFNINKIASDAYKIYTKDGGNLSQTDFMNTITKKYISGDDAEGAAENKAMIGIKEFFQNKNEQLQKESLLPRMVRVRYENGKEDIVPEMEAENLNAEQIGQFEQVNKNYIPNYFDLNKIVSNTKDSTFKLAQAIRVANPNSNLAESFKAAKEIISDRLSNNNPQHIFQTGIVKASSLKTRSLSYDQKTFIDYMQTNYHDLFYNYSKSINRDLALKQSFNTVNVDEILNNINKLYDDELNKNPQNITSINKERAYLLGQFRGELARFTGKDRNVLNTYTPAKSFLESAKMLQNAALMGRHGLLRSADLVASRLNYTFLSKFGDIFKNISDDFKNIEASKEDLEFMNLAQESHLTTQASNLGDIDFNYLQGKGVVNKSLNLLNHYVNIANLISPITDIGHRMLSNSVLQFLIGASKKIVGKSSDDITTFLNKSNFQTQPKEFWEKEFSRLGLNKQDAFSINDNYERFKNTTSIPGRTFINLSNWDSDIKLKVAEAITKEAHAQITSPTTGERPAWTRTPMGSTVLQFWGYRMALYQKRLLKTAQELYGYGSSASAIALARIGTSLATGIAQTATIQILKGLDLNTLDPYDLIKNGMEHGGILPVFDTVNNILDNYGIGLSALFGNTDKSKYFQNEPLTSNILGPTAGMLNDFFEAIKDTVSGHGSVRDLRLIMKHAPGWNLPYWGWITNNLFKSNT